VQQGESLVLDVGAGVVPVVAVEAGRHGLIAEATVEPARLVTLVGAHHHQRVIVVGVVLVDPQRDGMGRGAAERIAEADLVVPAIEADALAQLPGDVIRVPHAAVRGRAQRAPGVEDGSRLPAARALLELPAQHTSLSNLPRHGNAAALRRASPPRILATSARRATPEIVLAPERPSGAGDSSPDLRFHTALEQGVPPPVGPTQGRPRKMPRIFIEWF